MFAAAPISVDMLTARTVADALRMPEPLGWLCELSTALVDGRCEEGFHRTASTWFTSDLPIPEAVVGEAAAVHEEAGRITDRETRILVACVDAAEMFWNRADVVELAAGLFWRVADRLGLRRQ